MNILALESSCDETAAAVVKNGKEVLSHVVYSQIPTHITTGGVVPEVASREHVAKVLPIVERALKISGLTVKQIDAIAVTAMPGLITSLLVGVDTAKTLAYVWEKPLIAVNHLNGHIAAAGVTKMRMPDGEFQTFKVQEKFPRILLLVSGGHTQLFLEKNKNHRVMLGETLDDAAGEAFDKAARFLGLPYPGGKSLSIEATKGNVAAYDLPRPLQHRDDFMFSFSGLKTAFIDLARSVISGKSRSDASKNISELAPLARNNKVRADLCASFERAVIDSLYIKTEKAVLKYNAKQVVLAGGVAASKTLREVFYDRLKLHKTSLLVPDFSLCTDNAAMIGAEAYKLAKAKKFVDAKTLEPQATRHGKY